MKYILLLSLLLSGQLLQAQFGKKVLNKAKETAERKTEQKTDDAINKGVDKVEEAVTGKKKTKETGATGNEGANSGSTGSSSNDVTAGAANADGEFIIKTNITCATGKTKMETLLRDADGVNSVSIDSGTGKLYLAAAGNNEIYNNAIELIRANGFTADGKKPTKQIPTCK